MITKFSLKKAVNANGIAYSQAVFTVDRDLTSDEQAAISTMTAQIKSLATSVGFDEDNVHDSEMVSLIRRQYL